MAAENERDVFINVVTGHWTLDLDFLCGNLLGNTPKVRASMASHAPVAYFERLQ